MSPKLKNAIKDSGGVAIIFTIIQFINPYLFSCFTKLPIWIVLLEGMMFFLIMIPVWYYLDNRKKKR